MAIHYRNTLLIKSRDQKNEEASSLQYTYGASTDGETDDTRFIVSRKGNEVQPALEAAMESKMAAELEA